LERFPPLGLVCNNSVKILPSLFSLFPQEILIWGPPRVLEKKLGWLTVVGIIFWKGGFPNFRLLCWFPGNFPIFCPFFPNFSQGFFLNGGLWGKGIGPLPFFPTEGGFKNSRVLWGTTPPLVNCFGTKGFSPQPTPPPFLPTIFCVFQHTLLFCKLRGEHLYPQEGFFFLTPCGCRQSPLFPRGVVKHSFL